MSITAQQQSERQSEAALVREIVAAGATVRGNACNCPSPDHDDTRASGSIYADDKGTYRVKCHGCDWSGDVFDLRALNEARPVGDVLRDARGTATAPPPPPTRKKPRKTHPSIERAAGAVLYGLNRDGGLWTLTDHWRYRDPSGDLYAAVVRYDAEGDKTYRPLTREGEAWSIGDPDQWHPYRVDELPAEGLLWIVEGEKAADALWSVNLPATTSAHGAKSSGNTDWSALAGREVAIWPDANEAGDDYAREVADLLLQLDPPAEVRIITPPDDVPPGGDAFDWLEERDAHDPGELAATIGAMAEGATVHNCERIQLDTDRNNCSESVTGVTPGLIYRSADTIDTRPIDWFWEQRIPSGSIGLIMGMPNQGKSVLTMDIAARVTKGMPWPIGEKRDMPCGSVAVLAVEDSPEQVIVPRLKAAGADLSKILIVDGVSRIDGDLEDQAAAVAVRDSFDIARDIDKLKQVGEQVGDLKLVIIDPMDSFIGGKVDIFRGNEARQALWPLKDWAEQSGVTVLICHHLNKSPSGNVLDRVSGARSFGALPRSVWMIAADEDHTEGNRSILAAAKWNMSRRRPPATSYDIKPSLTDPDTPCVAWLADELDMSAGDLMARQAATDNGDPSAVDEASAFLLEVLGDGPRPSSEVRKLATQAGVSPSSLKRARRALGVKSEQIRVEDRVSGWNMELPDGSGG